MKPAAGRPSDRRSRRRRASMPAGPSRRCVIAQRARHHLMRAARPEYDARSARTAGASDNGLRHPARYGQNDCEIALGRKSWLFAGSERGADRAAAMTTLIMTAKLNDLDPQAWLTDVLGQIADIPQGRLAELLPWNWKQPNLRAAA
jgi:hypothetical protein